MANFNTIAGMMGCGIQTNVLAETAFGIAPANTVRAFLSMPPNISDSSLDGHEIVLRLGILVVTGGSFTYGPSVRLYSGSNTALTTFTNDTAIITPAAFTLATVQRMFTMEARLSWDDTTARLQGRYCFEIDTTFTNWVTLTAGLTAGVTHASNINFCVTGIFGTTSAANNAVLKYFEMDLV